MAKWFRALDLKSGGPWFKSSTLPLSGFVLGRPKFNSSTMLCILNSQLVSLQPVGILTQFIFYLTFIMSPISTYSAKYT